MKHFRRFRDDRFALTTLQNPLCEVRTRAELIQAAQQALQQKPDVAEIPATPPPAAPQPRLATITPPQAPNPAAAAALAPQNPPADRTPEQPSLHTTEISRPLREPVRKAATPQPSAPHTTKTSLSLREPVRKAPAPKPRRKPKRYTTPRRLPTVVPKR